MAGPRTGVVDHVDQGLLATSNGNRTMKSFLLMPNGELCLIADLVARNKITVKDHDRIPNQVLILRTLAGVKFHSSIDLCNWYFQIRVQPED
jgi:hypothetical protein